MQPRLPFDDPSVDALSDADRRAIAEHWRRRSRSELVVGRAFAAMVPVLQERGATAVVLEMLVRGASDEERHAALCVKLAETYAGAPVAPPEVTHVALPRFGVGDEELEHALLVAGMCCVNETLATAWLGACLDAATAPLAVAANRVHLQDEIDHARLGWAHLASNAVSRATRGALGECLPALLEANAPAWERDDPALPAHGIPAHGHVGTRASRRVAHDALRDLVLPGFAHVGVDTRAAQAWLVTRTSRTPAAGPASSPPQET